MKALTVLQPWASLITAGAKTVETRSWSTSHRGWIAIHAGVKRPRLAKSKPGEPTPADIAVHEIADPSGRNGQRICWCGHPPLRCLRYGLSTLPLGAIVATARLVDCVPMVQDGWPAKEPWRPALVIEGDTLTLYRTGEPDDSTDVDDQLPLGDFAPGRWAWLLEDIKPTTERCPWCMGEFDGWCSLCDDQLTCDPIPARGRQGLWEWALEAAYG